MFSFNAAGYSSINPTTSLPNLIQTAFNQSLNAVAINPFKSEVVLAGENILSFVDINAPNQPEIFNMGNIKISSPLLYNPQGSLLLIVECLDLDCFMNDLNILNISTKTIQSRCKNVSVANNILFNADGTKVVMRNVIGNNPPIVTDIIWDIYTNQQTIVSDPKANGIMYISGGRFNTFIMNSPDNTVIWDLNNPDQKIKLDIAPGNQTVFGNNRTQLAFSSNMKLDPIMYVRNGRQTTSISFNDGIVSTIAYCPKIKKFPFTIDKTSWSNADSINILDPETCEIKTLYNISYNISYNFPTFSSDGCKLFVLIDQDSKNIQFSLINFNQK